MIGPRTTCSIKVAVKPFMILLVLAALFTDGARAEAGDADFVKQGIAEYNQGDYANAAGHLGAALSTDFNNPVVHYYLANSYLKMKQKDGAIREFRIAYALQPTGELGEYAKKALVGLGVDVSDSAPKKDGTDVKAATSGPAATPAKSGTNLDKTLTSLEQQAQQEKSLRQGVWDSASNSIQKSGDDVVQRTKTDMINSIPSRYGRWATPTPTVLSGDSQKQLDSMRQYYDGQKAKYAQGLQEQTKEIQKSYDNLRQLLNESSNQSGAKLVPEGTNLYVRNYQSSTSAKPKGP